MIEIIAFHGREICVQQQKVSLHRQHKVTFFFWFRIFPICILFITNWKRSIRPIDEMHIPFCDQRWQIRFANSLCTTSSRACHYVMLTETTGTRSAYSIMLGIEVWYKHWSTGYGELCTRYAHDVRRYAYDMHRNKHTCTTVCIIGHRTSYIMYCTS